MPSKKFRSLREKIILTIIIVVVLSLICAGVFFFAQARNIANTLIDSNKQMAQTSRSRSSDSMTELNEARLQELADDKAALADRTFFEFRQAVSMVASAAAQIYENSDAMPQRDVPLPDAANDGTLAVQLLFSSSTDPSDEAIEKEAKLLGNLQDTLYAVNEKFESTASVYFASESGIMVQADYISGAKFDSSGNIMPLDAKGRPWYHGAAVGGEPYITPVTRDLHTPRMAIMCGVPVYHEGKLMGVAGAGMYLENISSLLPSSAINESGDFCIINQYGQILFTSYSEGPLAINENNRDLRLSSDPDMIKLAQNALNGKHGIQKLDINGKASYAAYAPVETVGWSIFIILSQEEADAPTIHLQEDLDSISSEAISNAELQSKNSISLFIAIVCAILIAALVASLILSGRIVTPIQKLTKEVQQTKGDELDFKWDMNTGDETQLLADSFQSLTERVKTYVEDMRRITAEQERVGTEMALATRIQADMLPNIFPPFPERKDFDIYASMDPAKEVGGDFYDFYLIDDDHLALTIADVSGKGVPAALFMMISKILIKNHVGNGLSPAKVLEKVNDQICSNNREEMFVTVWLGILDLKTGILKAANAGHEYPILKQPGGKFELIKDPHGFVVGGFPEMDYKEYEWQLKPGATLFVYTDGVPEAGGERSNLYGTDRLLDVLNASGSDDPEKLLEAVTKDVSDFVGDAPQFDDLTMLCMHYKGPQL